jgi:predicted PurR-regulated permease PerM
MMNYRLQIGFFLILIVATMVLNIFVFLPYISVIFLAGIFAIIFEPLHKKFLTAFKGRETIAALFSVLTVLLFILIPITFFGTLLFQESTSVYEKISNNRSEVLNIAKSSIDSFEGFVNRVLPRANLDISESFNLDSAAGAVFGWLSNHLATLFSSVLKGIMGFFLMILALFYLFRDGRKLVKKVTELSPLVDSDDGKIVTKLKTAVNSVIRGQITIALIQGVLTGIGFAIFGVPNPVIWGTVAALASLVPTLGTSLVIAPALIFLFATGHFFQMIGLLIWGIGAVGLIDNFLGPILIERGVKIHPYIILISVLGGIGLFGPIGFIAGPVVLSLLYALLDIYPTLVKQSSK